jgi:DNA-binding LacI/PurR family transcriptional regulator
VTLLDVARRAGVGKSTVSNVVNGTGRVSATTRAAVLDAVGALGYTPNVAARRLRRAQSGTVGVYMAETPTESEWFMRFVFGALHRLAPHDVDVALVTEAATAARGRLPALDGVIVSDPALDDDFATALLRMGVPVVTCERVLGAGRADGTVWADHAAATRDLFAHLHDAGARVPALLVPPPHTDWAAQLDDGYRAWCTDAGVEPHVVTVDWIPTVAQLEDRVARLLDDVPALDALVCGPVESAAPVIPMLRSRGRRVGTDVLLACGTDSAGAAAADPPLTAIDQRPREAGERCAELLLGLLDGTVAAGVEVEHAVALVTRASTAGRSAR